MKTIEQLAKDSQGVARHIHSVCNSDAEMLTILAFVEMSIKGQLAVEQDRIHDKLEKMKQ